MLSEALTDLSIKALRPRADSRYEVFDAKIPGFAVRVAPSGMKSFVLLYRHRGRPRRLTIGRYPVLSLAEARKLANHALNRVAHGNDPQHEKEERRRGHSFEDAADDFVTTHCARRNRASTASHAAGTLRLHFIPKWRNRDVREIKRADILSVLDKMMRDEMPGAAIRSLAVIRKFFNWCVERGLIDASPCAGVKAPAPHRSRDRVLDDKELAAIWRAAAETEFPFGSIVQLLILTAQRRGEVTAMRWSEIDFEAATWSLPSERTKSNRAHTVPLTPAAVELLASLPKFGEGFVFPAQGRTETSFSGFSKCKTQFDQLARVTDWRLHDLRRTAATGMARLGVSPHVVERILNHTTGTLGGVAGVYNRFGYLPEMRAALKTWAKHVVAHGSLDSKS